MFKQKPGMSSSKVSIHFKRFQLQRYLRYVTSPSCVAGRHGVYPFLQQAEVDVSLLGANTLINKGDR